MSDIAERALAHLQNILKGSGLEAEGEIISREADDLTVAITGPDAGLLVGSHGQALDALQHLLVMIVNNGQSSRVRLTLDADGYRARRIKTLNEFALNLAAQVAESQQEAITDPLNAMERRVIHTALADHADVKTYSEGDGQDRYVVISPRAVEAVAAE